MKILGTSAIWLLIVVGVWYWTKTQCKECNDSLQVIKISTKEFVAPEKETTIPEPKKVQVRAKKKVVFYSDRNLGNDEDFVSFVLDGDEAQKSPEMSDSGFLFRDLNLYEIQDSTDAWKLKATAYVDGELISFSPSIQINCPPQKILTKIPKFALMPSAYYFHGSGFGIGGNLLYKNYTIGARHFPQKQKLSFSGRVFNQVEIMVKLKDIFTNPANPRIIRDDKYKKLVKSIDEFPKMMELRPIIVDSEGMILGGNMRYKALKELGYKEVPATWIKQANDLTEDEIRRFTIADNVGFGEWDYELLANEWDVQELQDWVDLPGFAIMPNDDELTDDFRNKPPTLKITFVSPEQLQSAEIDIQEILDRKYKGAFFSVSAGEL